MNILDIQDKLKGLPDQFLAQELQNPSGQAPQYLVLSELKRRKEMRASSAGQQAPKQSMAEEAAAGVAALPVPPGMGPPARNAGAPMPQQPPQQMPPQGMYQGGVVRMQAGGSLFQEQLDRMTREELLEARRSPEKFPFLLSEGRTPSSAKFLVDQQITKLGGGSQAGRHLDAVGSAVGAVGSEIGAIGRAAVGAGAGAASLVQQGAAGVRDAAAGYFQPSFPDAPTPAPSAPPPQLGDGEQPSSPFNAPSAPAPAAAAAPPTAAAAGLGSLAGRSPVAAEAAAAMKPAPQQEEVDPIAGLRKQLEGYRADSVASRKDAQNMALMEAGLRIAGSQNPNFMGALADGAPAIGSYAKQIQDIKKGDRDNFQTEAYLERVGMDERYRKGTLAAQQRQLDISERSEARRAAGGGGGGGLSWDKYASADPATRELMDQFKGGANREYQQNVMLAQRVAQAQNNDLVLKKYADQLNMVDPGSEQFKQLIKAIDDRRADIEKNIIGIARPGSGTAPPAAGGARTYDPSTGSLR